MQNLKYFTWVLSLGLLVSSSSFAIEKKWDGTLVMGFNPAENREAMDTNSNALTTYFSKKSGIPTKGFVATDYTGLVEAMRSGQVQLAWLPPLSFVQAERVADAEVLMKATHLNRDFFYGSIVVRADKNIKTLDDLKGKSIAWVDPASASGHLFPKAALIEKTKMSPDAFFKRQVFAGSHDAVVLAVANGTVDAGATFTNNKEGTSSAWTQYQKGATKPVDFRILLLSAPIPTETMAVKKSFHEKHADVVKKITETFAQMHKDPEGKKILMDLYKMDSAIPAKSSDYDSVRKAAKELGLLSQ